ncbi:F-box protein [Prunus yedoensis var. nudiflora]|uniref:F-box protein n=1 Tax=Prunus yedoensis var. nudiflora TaxID=2094558 RepID=A0A314XM77_PRUYE|nr:F-box protein [Prunus yedoensis var. nudiflora]
MSIWVMKEHGVKESWSLELKIVMIGSPSTHVFKFENGQVLLLILGKLMAYASWKGFVDVELEGTGHFKLDAHVLIPSFVSPKHIISGVRARSPDQIESIKLYVKAS